jgi:hypothetical protein
MEENSNLQIPEIKDTLRFIEKESTLLKKSIEKFNLSFRSIAELYETNKIPEMREKILEIRQELQYIISIVPNCESSRKLSNQLSELYEFTTLPLDYDSKKFIKLNLVLIPKLIENLLRLYSDKKNKLIFTPFEITRDLVNIKKMSKIIIAISSILGIIQILISLFKN